jgi:probable O-glycosylation ligase (exosortase A-associated)
MGKLLLALIILSTGMSAIAHPWVGIIAYYLLAIFGPQYIWWWAFGGLRVSFIVALSTFCGTILHLSSGKLDFRFLKTKLNFWALILWTFVIISYYFGPYVSKFRSAGLGPEELFPLNNKMFIFYFCATLIMDRIKNLRYLSFVFIGAALYMIYWANMQYFNQNWYQFNMGRLMGPYDIWGGSIYRDENAFAMFFVTGIPFLYYLSLGVQRSWLRFLLWGFILLGVHAVFLTGSRGGLVGLGVISAYVALKSRNKLFVLPLIFAILFIAFYWQGGSVMKERSETISDYEGEGSAEQRITAWKGGAGMISAHPLIGVGLGSFITALPDFSDTSPRVAHNTFIQFAAESGVIAGLAYLMIVSHFFISSIRINKWCLRSDSCLETQQLKQVRYLNDASTASFAGLVVCSLFLSLNAYEIFFYLLIFSNSLNVLCLSKA